MPAMPRPKVVGPQWAGALLRERELGSSIQEQ